MPKQRTLIEYDYSEFEQLVVKELGLMSDYSVVAAEEWGNDEDHTFTIGPLDSFDDFDRDEIEEIKIAIMEYQAAVAANGGLDPYARFSLNRIENTIVQAARGKLLHVLNWNTHRVFEMLVEKGVIEPVDYNISVSW